MRTHFKALIWLAALLIAPSRSARAQLPPKPAPKPTPTAGFAMIMGAVDDSLRRGPLVGATVIVLGTNRITKTDARGMFVFDSLTPGEVRIGVRHPLLDTISNPILSDKVQLVAGQRLEVTVSTPTLQSLRDRACARGGVVYGPAMLFGKVLEADTDEPIAAVNVSLVYRDVEMADGRERVRQARTKEDGTYAICGLPENLTGTVQAQKGPMTSGELGVVMKNDMLGTASLTFSMSNEKLSALQGKVINKIGEPVEGAQIAVAGTGTVAVTKADGTYSLTNLPAGTLETTVRKLGYAPVTKAVALTKREPRRLNIVLDAAQTLAAVRVEGKLDNGLQKTGFTDRKKAGMGNFISPEDIARRKPYLFTDLLQTMPGFRVVDAGRGKVVQASRPTGTSSDGCVNVFIDRSPFQVMSPGELDQVLSLGDLGAVETYPSATDTPAEYQVSGKGCATILIWTKTRLARP